ncbi:aspartyl-phosphate phosphatase Spo0E family protein [Thalassobacillus devorans]|nr:aspartyl-phosphate phosphatase Spo0E family protein [Thalassobacillus devorans]
MELLRKKMYQTYENNPQDSQILAISQSLDELLNELDRCLREKSNKK